MPSQTHFSRWPRRWPLWVAAGLILRLVFIYFPRPIDPDTWDYLQLGHNFLHQGIYGVGDGNDIAPTLFRLPGYPIFLGVFELLFARIWPNTWFTTVFLAQSGAAIGAGLLLAAFARQHLSGRAAEVALALAMLCPFTAVYDATALTESFSFSLVALGIYAAGRALAAQAAGRHDLWALILAGCAAGLAMLLRPDGAVLLADLAGGIFFYSLRRSRAAQSAQAALRSAFSSAFIVCLVALLPLVPWTLRNFAQFHVFQPLAPRYFNDPGSRVNLGFYRWVRSWSIEFVTTANVVWNAGEGPLDPADLPPRAFDSPRQREETLRLIADYNLHDDITAALDDRFGAIADERVRARPFRYYVTLPVLRVADMLLRPRTEDFYLDVFWWRWSVHPAQTIAAILLGLINLAYVAAAVWAFLARRVPWALMLGAYLVLRFALLGVIEHPEPRYTLECFPIFIVAAAAALTRSKPCAASAFSPSLPIQPQFPVRQSSSG
jgi:hypothetical protein